MVPGVGVAPDVAQPDVGAAVSQQVGQAPVGQVGQPVGRGSDQTVLQDDHWLPAGCPQQGNTASLLTVLKEASLQSLS